MKRTVIVLILLFLTINAFAVDFSISAGAGGLLGYTFTRYTMEGGNFISTQNMDRFDYAGFVFVDFTYAELAVMYKGGNNTYSEDMIIDNDALADDKGAGSETSLGISLLGKFPFKVDERFSWFPMLGIEYQIALKQVRAPEDGLLYDRSKGHTPEDRDKNDDPYPLSAWNSFWINVGAGVDFYIYNSIFLRSELLFGFRLPTEYELGALEKVKAPPINIKDPTLSGLTGSPMLKIGVGYRF
ncbi:MAG: hypothetical protein LBU66_00620 [Treponema sp.]|jgi:hypothetical protein|nr:hypothetical protein [Treponema sp.]